MSLGQIDHIVVLMLENRSFDTMLGKLYPKSATFDGLDGTEQNPDSSGVPVQVLVVRGQMKSPCASLTPIRANYGPTSTRNCSGCQMSEVRLPFRPWMGLSKTTSTNRPMRDKPSIQRM